MNYISINIEDWKVVFYEGQGRNVEVYVDGECQEDSQRTWFFHALLEETIRLQNENKKLKGILSNFQIENEDDYDIRM